MSGLIRAIVKKIISFKLHNYIDSNVQPIAKFSPEANSLWPLNVDAAKLDSENLVSKIG